MKYTVHASPSVAIGRIKRLLRCGLIIWQAIVIVMIEFAVDGATGRALDLRSTGRGFESYSGQKLCNNFGQVVHTYVPLSPSSVTCYRPRDGDVVQLGR